MAGIFGGAVDETMIEAMESVAVDQDWYEDETVCESALTVFAKTHGGISRADVRTYRTDRLRGAIYGVVYGDPLSNYGGERDFLQAVLEDPDEVLAAVDGSFFLVVVDVEDERLLAATDKLSTHQCYYTTADRFAFGTEFKTLVPAIPDPSVNSQGLGDMLQNRDCFIWGEKTFVDEIRAVRPATYLEYDGESVETTEYWDIEYEQLPAETYTERLLDAYETAVVETTSPLDGTVGANLSGGVDSRLLVSILSEHVDDLHTVTYDIHDRADTEPARETAQTLRIRNEFTPISVSDFKDMMERGAELTDAMVPWLDYTNIRYVQEKSRSRFTTHIQSHGQGPLFGDHFFCETHFETDDPIEVFYEFYYREGGYADELLTDDVDPRDSIAGEVEKYREDSVEKTLLKVNRKNYYHGYHHRREQYNHHCVPTVDILTNGRILTLAENMPRQYRSHERELPGKIPSIIDPVPRLKLELITERGSGIEDIKYNRTQHPPSTPYWQQKLRYWLGHRLQIPGFRLPSGFPTTYIDLSRNDEEFRTMLWDLVESVADRPFVDGDALRELANQHFSGEADYIRPISILTSLEVWLQRYFD